ncbi:hypothetical protein PG997_010627 [Apiospora hydei]|uniref:Secreted protein n=1 Tax=Apiospora hydei TaxID=1337664 RepID=A0ABR1VGQ7_9PEZI
MFPASMPTKCLAVPVLAATPTQPGQHGGQCSPHYPMPPVRRRLAEVPWCAKGPKIVQQGSTSDGVANEPRNPPPAFESVVTDQQAAAATANNNFAQGGDNRHHIAARRARAPSTTTTDDGI